MPFGGRYLRMAQGSWVPAFCSLSSLFCIVSGFETEVSGEGVRPDGGLVSFRVEDGVLVSSVETAGSWSRWHLDDLSMVTRC